MARFLCVKRRTGREEEGGRGGGRRTGEAGGRGVWIAAAAEECNMKIRNNEHTIK